MTRHSWLVGLHALVLAAQAYSARRSGKVDSFEAKINRGLNNLAVNIEQELQREASGEGP